MLPILPTHPETRAELAWGFFLLLCLALYLFGLGSPYAPTNGDEMVYLHISRMTANTGHWLPLASEIVDTRNTKPPLLFWQAMFAGDWGTQWQLWRLRLPSIAYTFACTALLAALTQRISGSLRKGLQAACLFLLFFSTFRYCRAYLTSGPETFWFGLPMFYLLWHRLRHTVNPPPITWLVYGLFGISIGLGLLYKSFALVAPACATLWCAILLTEPQLNWRLTLRTTVGLALSSVIAVGMFALWFVLDPDPASVWQEFIVAENAGKMSRTDGYWHAAFYGAYPMWQQLLAYPENAALLAFPVFGLGWVGLKAWWTRASGWRPTPALWILLLWLGVWLTVFTIPSQRSARYVIPTMPALAMLMALYWERIARPWFWITALLMAPALVLLARIGWVMGDMGIASPTQLAITLVAACAGMAGVLATFVSKSSCRAAALVACAAVYASFGLMVAPLSQPELGYSPTVQQRLTNQRVAVPNGFTGQYERFYFVLPGARLTPYDAEGRNTGALFPDMPPDQRLDTLLDRFDAVVWLQDSLDQAQPACVPRCTLLGQRWHVKSRHKSGEVTWANLWYPQEWLFRREWLVAKTAP